MADIKPTQTQKDTSVDKPDNSMTPQELEVKKATDDAKAQDERQTRILELIKTKKYFLPIK